MPAAIRAAGMMVFLLKRFAGFLVGVRAAAVVGFVGLEVLPGDPARVMLGVEAQPESVKALRAELGLDRPAAARYLTWIGGLSRGDLGISYTYRVPVAELIGERLAVTLPLALISTCLSGLLALGLRLHPPPHR